MKGTRLDMKRIAFTSLLLSCLIGLLIATKPEARAQENAAKLFDFEASLASWAVAPANPDAGALSAAVNQNGPSEHSLRIDVSHPGWFGINESAAQLPISSDKVKNWIFVLSSTSEKTPVVVAFQVGSEYHWCQSSVHEILPNSQKTLKLNFAAMLASKDACMGSAPVDSSDVRGIWLYFGQEGTYFLDELRAQ